MVDGELIVQEEITFTPRFTAWSPSSSLSASRRRFAMCSACDIFVAVNNDSARDDYIETEKAKQKEDQKSGVVERTP